eukprot:jgi/Botrbrau1/12167/Bobra.0186s0075.1
MKRSFGAMASPPVLSVMVQARFYKNQELAVVGGGDTATEEAVYLTKYGKHVHLLVRSSKLRASGAMQDRVKENPKITLHLNTEVVDAFGDSKKMQGLELVDTVTGEKRKLPVKGLFYGIGHKPNSGIVAGQIELDQAGYVKVHDGVRTNVEGVFAAGDLFDTEWRQAITAAGSGCMAALSAERFLSASGLLTEYHLQAQEEEPVVVTIGKKKEEFDIEQDRHKGQFALRKLYHESPRLLVVMYTSPTCGPCRTLKPIFNKVVDEFPKQLHFVEIDIEQDPEIAEAGGVNGTPTVQIFKSKERLHNLPGVKMKREYRELIQNALQGEPVRQG